MAALRYELLLDLYRGKGTAVEQIAKCDRAAIAIPTPLISYLEAIDTCETPKHVFLTGNAGDGKSFAAVTANISGMRVVCDASESFGSAEDPLSGLASLLEKYLSAGDRLLVAINRGQMDRLLGYVQENQSQAPRVCQLLTAARGQLRLAVDGVESDELVAVIDLGLFDTVSDTVTEALLDRVATAEITGGITPQTRIATVAAQEGLLLPEVRDSIKRALRAARTAGTHATMRQLWTLVAYLVTGGRAVDEERAPDLSDSVGARLYDERSAGTLAPVYGRLSDPCQTSQPSIAKRVLAGSWEEMFRDVPGLGSLATLPVGPERGKIIVRAAAVHGVREFVPDDWIRPADTYERAIGVLAKSTGWQDQRRISDTLLHGIYGALGLWRTSGSFPAWSRLCYDAHRIASAGAVACARIAEGDLRVGLPRPPQTTLDALGEAWWPPHILLGFSGQVEKHPLRITPSMFRALSGQERRVLAPASVFLLQRWLASARTEARTEAEARIDTGRGALRVAQGLDDRISLMWEGGA